MAVERSKRKELADQDSNGGGGNQGNVWVDVWLWKCIPNGEDLRPKWRQSYDNGQIKYEYTYQNSDECFKYFRVRVKYKILEILCTDARCPDLSIHHQRVHEMNNLSIEDYTTIAFQKMCGWFPQFNQGVELSKFMKMVKDCRIFPDIKKPNRVGQLENLFLKELKSDSAIIDKYVNYTGFCRLLQEIALIRYPPGQTLNSKADDSSVASNDDNNSDTLSLSSSITGSIQSSVTGAVYIFNLLIFMKLFTIIHYNI
jgi:hypothetical protein